MNVDLFGAASSPSCAQFSLLQSVEEQKDNFDKEVRLLIQRKFCTYDCLFAALRLRVQLNKCRLFF